jgi:hemolysin activation/secretion protein
MVAGTLGAGAPAHAVDEPTLSAGLIGGSSAYTPVARIEASEAQITRVHFTGDAGPHAARLEELASDLSLRTAVRTVDLEATLQSMRELPGLTVRASTRRDESRLNGYALTVATEYKPFDATLQLANRGRRELGPMFVVNQVVANGLLGHRERLGLFAVAATDTGEYRGGGLFVEVPAGTFDSTSAMQLAWSAAFDWDDLEITREDTGVRSEKTRVFELGGRVTGRTGSASHYVLGLQVRRGLDALGSQLDARDLVDDPRRKDFLITRLQFTELVRFAQRWSMRLDAFGQQSAYVLPDVERYKIRGERLGRGFDATGIAGDQGVGAKAELRRELSAAAAPPGKTSLYGFYDFAAAWKQDRPGRKSAATVGLGVAVEYWRLSGFIEVAKPLTHTDTGRDRDPKVFAEVRLKL